MVENKLADMSTEFAVKILNLTDGINGHYSLSNQFERSGTSIGANIISEEIAKSVLHDCGSIRRMLIASINTAKGEK